MRLDCCSTFGIDMCQGLLRIRMKLHAEKFIEISLKYFSQSKSLFFSKSLANGSCLAPCGPSMRKNPPFGLISRIEVFCWPTPNMCWPHAPFRSCFHYQSQACPGEGVNILRTWPRALSTQEKIFYKSVAVHLKLKKISI